MKALRFWLTALLCGLLASPLHAALYSRPSSSAGAAYVHASSAGTADVASASATETVAYDWTLPALGAKDAAAITVLVTGSGTGNKLWKLRIGGTGIDGTTLWTFTSGNAVQQIVAGFSNDNNTSVQIAYSSGTGGMNTATGITALNTAAVATASAGVHVYLTVTKSTAADVVNVKAIKAMIYPGV